MCGLVDTVKVFFGTINRISSWVFDLAGARPPGLTAKLIWPRWLPSGGALLFGADRPRGVRRLLRRAEASKGAVERHAFAVWLARQQAQDLELPERPRDLGVSCCSRFMPPTVPKRWTRVERIAATGRCTRAEAQET